MATSLSELINARLDTFAPGESNLEDGQIFAYCSGRTYGCFTSCFAWYTPAAGTAKVEIWGAGGSTGCQCCCNFSIGGQSGAYARKEVTMASGGRVCGNTGHPCMPNAGFCYVNCSMATCVSICLGTANTCSCMCAQGGNGGFQGCRTSTSAMCCLEAAGFPTVNASSLPCATGAACGFSCGKRGRYHDSIAYGGDVNCPGNYACTGYYHCDSSSNTSYIQHSNAIPHGQYATKVATSMVGADSGHTMTNSQSGQGPSNLQAGKSAINRSGGSGFEGHAACWNSGIFCACYETLACIPFVPPGQGSSMMQGCPNVRNVGSRGGLGYVRILFKAT